MIPLNKCPICNGDLIEKKVEKLLRGGNNTAVLKVQAEVCEHCGERLYSMETINYFEQIRKKLKQQDVADLKPMGQSYQNAG